MTERSDHALSISVAEPSRGLFVVSLVGDLDVASCVQLSEHLSPLARAEPVRVILDLTGLEFIDSSGLNALVTGARAIEGNGGWMALTGASRYIARVFDLVRLHEEVEVRASLEESLALAEAHVSGKKSGR